jgi:hypothetical protein
VIVWGIAARSEHYLLGLRGSLQGALQGLQEGVSGGSQGDRLPLQQALPYNTL